MPDTEMGLTMANINTKQYWNKRFASGDWEQKRGRSQTTVFAMQQVRHLHLSREFSGALLDFGCGLGDAIPIYSEHFPKARLIGVDIAEAAIDKCKTDYGSLADFFTGDDSIVPAADVIIASNVFEHLSDDRGTASRLLEKCRDLFITVPYRENLPSSEEHVNRYDDDSFQEFETCCQQVFLSRGWSEYGVKLWIDIRMKNLFRPLLGRPTRRRSRQIMYHLKGRMGS